MISISLPDHIQLTSNSLIRSGAAGSRLPASLYGWTGRPRRYLLLFADSDRPDIVVLLRDKLLSAPSLLLSRKLPEMPGDSGKAL